jgi:hypothetical protein
MYISQRAGIWLKREKDAGHRYRYRHRYREKMLGNEHIA